MDYYNLLLTQGATGISAARVAAACTFEQLIIYLEKSGTRRPAQKQIRQMSSSGRFDSRKSKSSFGGTSADLNSADACAPRRLRHRARPTTMLAGRGRAVHSACALLCNAGSSKGHPVPMRSWRHRSDALSGFLGYWHGGCWESSQVRASRWSFSAASWLACAFHGHGGFWLRNQRNISTCPFAAAKLHDRTSHGQPLSRTLIMSSILLSAAARRHA